MAGVWELRVGMVRLEDSGLYECQANTEPKRQFSVELLVKDTVAVISGPRELFLVAGSTLRLHCTVWLGDRKQATDTQTNTQYCQLSTVTCHRLTFNCLKPHVNCHLSQVNCQLSTVNCPLSHVNCHLSQVNCQFSPVNSQLPIVTCLKLTVTCHQYQWPDVPVRGPDAHWSEHAVLHWFLDQRLLDPGTTRGRPVQTSTTITNRMEVIKLIIN